jgi:hypothetical protein
MPGNSSHARFVHRLDVGIGAGDSVTGRRGKQVLDERRLVQAVAEALFDVLRIQPELLEYPA